MQTPQLAQRLQRVHSKYADCTISLSTGESIPATRCLLAAASDALDKRIGTCPAGGIVSLIELDSLECLEELVRYSVGQPPVDEYAAKCVGNAFGIPSLASLRVSTTSSSSTGSGKKGGKANGAVGNGVVSDSTTSKQIHGDGANSLNINANGTSGAGKKSIQSSPRTSTRQSGSMGGGATGTSTSSSSGKFSPASRLNAAFGFVSEKLTHTLDRLPTDSNVSILFYDYVANSYPVLQTLAFVGGISCWYHAWFYNLEQGGLFMDDVMIKRNLNVVDPQFDWDRLIRTDYWGLEMFDPQVWTHKSFRPVTVYSFRFDYQNFGFDSHAFHRHNIVLHGLSGLLLGYVANRILKMGAVFSSLLSFLFLTHPVHTESLLYIVGRADPQCCDIFLLAIVIYDSMIQSAHESCAKNRGIVTMSNLIRTGSYLFLSLFLVVMSGFCKEIGFTVFALLVMLEGYYLLAPPAVSVASGNGDKPVKTVNQFFCAARVAAVIVIGTLVIIWRFQYTQGTQIARMDPYSNPIAAHDNAYQQVLSYWYVHGRYAELLVYPKFLNYDYSMNAVPLILSLTDVRLLLPAAAYATLCVGVHFTMHQFHTSLGRASGFGLATFAVSFLPMSNILFPVGTLIAERLLYIPSVGYLLVLVACMNMMWLRCQKFARPTRILLQTSLVASLVALGVFYWVRCYVRIFDWKDSETITEVDGLSQPWSGRTSFNIANLYLSRKDYDRALEAYIRSIKSDPEERDSMPLYHAGQIFIYRGDWGSAEQYLKKAVGGYFSPLTLAEEEVFHDYGMALWHVNKAPESIYNLQASIITNPNFAKGYNNLACAQVLYGLDLKNQEMVNQGLGSLEKALSIAPDMALYWRNAAVLLGFIGDQAASRNAWNKFALYDPSAAVQPIPDNCVWEFYFR
ncbi:unnamed protein product [Amoebophrya sp. A25]|nr:unnamed protein product [Amoebophrya sp. A25]|eukprot:GSA25T00012336001.1